MSAIGPELENPETRPALIALGALVAFAFLYGLNQLAWQFMKAVFGFLFSVPLVGGWIASHLHHAVEAVNHWFGNNAAAIDRHLARSWHQIAGVFDFIGQMFLLVASAIWLLAREVRALKPEFQKLIGQSPTAKVANRADARAKHAQVTAATATAVAGSGVRARSRAVPSPWRRWARAQAKQAAIEGALLGSAVAERTVPLQAINEAQRKRLSLLEKALGALGLAALVDIGLRKLDLGHLRCRNNRRIGKAFCGFPSGLLETLLSGAIEALAVVDICRIAHLVTRLARLFEPELRALVVIENAALCNGQHDPAARLPIRGQPWPAATAPLPL